jgi:hypothetical protein
LNFSQRYSKKSYVTEILSKAESILDRTLNFNEVNDNGGVNIGLLRAKIDVAKYLTSTLGKNSGYTNKLEFDGNLNQMIVNVVDFDSSKVKL